MTQKDAVAAVRAELAAACRVLASEGQGDLVWGHASVRDPRGRGVWMKAAGWGYEEVTPERTVLVGFDGRLVEGDGRVHIEAHIHTRLLAVRPDANAVVHCHSTWPLALVATGQRLQALSHDAAFFGVEGPAVFTETGDLICTPELGDTLAAAVGDRRGAILAGHGTVTVGADLPTAVLGAVVLDRACRLHVQAAAVGPVAGSDEAEIRSKQERVWGPAQIHDAWRYLVRRVDGSGGDDRHP